MPRQRSTISSLDHRVRVSDDHRDDPASPPVVVGERHDRDDSDPLDPPSYVARELGLSPQTLANWRCLGNDWLPWTKIRGRVRYRRSRWKAAVAAAEAEAARKQPAREHVAEKVPRTSSTGGSPTDAEEVGAP